MHFLLLCYQQVMTMNYRDVTAQLEKGFPFGIFRGSGFSSKAYEAGDTYLHRHHCLEINCCLQGTGRYEIGDQSYPIATGDLFILNDLEYHRAINDSGQLELLVLEFNADLVLSGEEDYGLIRAFYEWKQDFKRRIPADDPVAAQTKAMMLELEREWECKEVGYTLVIKALLLKLLATLYRSFEQAEGNAQKVRNFQSGYLRLKPAITMLDTNFRKPLTLEQLAESVHLNRNYFSTIFTQLMGCSVSEYLIRQRLRNALQLLSCTNWSLETIAHDSGFHNISYFSRTFRKHFGISPGQYRQELWKDSAQSR